MLMSAPASSRRRTASDRADSVDRRSGGDQLGEDLPMCPDARPVERGVAHRTTLIEIHLGLGQLVDGVIVATFRRIHQIGDRVLRAGDRETDAKKRDHRPRCKPFSRHLPLLPTMSSGLDA
jgi:hypothetical protein